MAKKLYKEYRNQLQTGDIALFSGKGGISAGIKWATWNRWSHVGMVLKLPKEYNFVCLWESTTLNTLKDLDSETVHKGVQLVPLSARIRQYDGDIAIRHIQGVSFGDDDIKELMALRTEMAGRPYEKKKLELIKAAYDGPFGNNMEDLSSLFCSELVAEAYQHLRLLKEPPNGKESNEYTPADFSQDKESMSWLRGELGPEIELTLAEK